MSLASRKVMYATMVCDRMPSLVRLEINKILHDIQVIVLLLPLKVQVATTEARSLSLIKLFSHLLADNHGNMLPSYTNISEVLHQQIYAPVCAQIFYPCPPSLLSVSQGLMDMQNGLGGLRTIFLAIMSMEQVGCGSSGWPMVIPGSKPWVPCTLGILSKVGYSGGSQMCESCPWTQRSQA